MTNLTPIEAGAAGRVPAAQSSAEPTTARSNAKARRGDDRVEVSEAARFLARMNAMPEIRSELVSRVRDEIVAGHYDTPEKMDLAIDAMLEELG